MHEQSNVPSGISRVILEHAEREYPSECCGLVFAEEKDPDKLLRVRPCRNVQDGYHEKFPSEFPRSSKTAYLIDPMELLAVQKEIRLQKEVIRIIYHSHVNAEPYFSGEDTVRAVDDLGEPLYPGTDYIVVSVKQAKAGPLVRYAWDQRQRTFVRIRPK